MHCQNCKKELTEKDYSDVDWLKDEVMRLIQSRDRFSQRLDSLEHPADVTPKPTRSLFTQEQVNRAVASLDQPEPSPDDLAELIHSVRAKAIRLPVDMTDSDIAAAIREAGYHKDAVANKGGLTESDFMPLLNGSHYIDIKVRYNGEDVWFDGGFLKETYRKIARLERELKQSKLETDGQLSRALQAERELSAVIDVNKDLERELAEAKKVAIFWKNNYEIVSKAISDLKSDIGTVIGE
jgi:hypothetical protein